MKAIAEARTRVTKAKGRDIWSFQLPASSYELSASSAAAESAGGWELEAESLSNLL
jgi:hypothetical protein